MEQATSDGASDLAGDSVFCLALLVFAARHRFQTI
jgi:hypothetical protein